MITSVQVMTCENKSRFLCGLKKDMTHEMTNPISGKRTILCAIF